MPLTYPIYRNRVIFSWSHRLSCLPQSFGICGFTRDGKYCTFPHGNRFLNKPYADIFTILTSYPSLEKLSFPLYDAWQGGAQDQLQGQIASAKIPLSRMISPQLYWVMTGDDFTLDLNNPEHPKILCVGNNPDRQNIYSAALGLYNSRIVKLVNKKGQLKSSIIIDELPTIYFRGYRQPDCDRPKQQGGRLSRLPGLLAACT